MIEAIIFDLGDVFLNLNSQASIDAFKKLGLTDWNDDLKEKSLFFEISIDIEDNCKSPLKVEFIAKEEIKDIK